VSSSLRRWLSVLIGGKSQPVKNTSMLKILHATAIARDNIGAFATLGSEHDYFSVRAGNQRPINLILFATFLWEPRILHGD